MFIAQVEKILLIPFLMQLDCVTVRVRRYAMTGGRSLGRRGRGRRVCFTWS
jgi:hypothetical protein